MHIQHASRRREAVVASDRRAVDIGGGEPGPDHIGGVEGVQVVKIDCKRWGTIGGRFMSANIRSERPGLA
jgi:hypothetical protein